MHFFEVNHEGDIQYGINAKRIDLGQGGDGTHYRIEVDSTNPPTKSGDKYLAGSYRKETLGDQVVLFLQCGKIDDDSALVVFRNESYKATCFVVSGGLDQVLVVEDDDDGFRVLVVEMEKGDSLEIKNRLPAFTISYNIHLAPQMERLAKVFS